MASPVLPSGGISRSVRHRRAHLSIHCSPKETVTASEIADTPRRRRVRRRDRRTAKGPEPIDLEKEMKQALLAEEAKWAGPSEDEILGERPHPLLGAVLESVVQRMIGMNVCCNNALQMIFEERFPTAKAAVDYVEFRLLEVDGKGVMPVQQFFLDFGYKEEDSFVLTDKEKPIHCKILKPPLHRHLPKIVLSYLKVNEDLSERCQEVIQKRMGEWLSMSDKYSSTALSIIGAPWNFPDKAEFEIIEEESAFAAWSIVHGITPATMAMSVNEMQKAFYKFGSNPDQITLEQIWECLSDSFPMNPASEHPIWVNKKGVVRVVAPVAEVIPISLADGSRVDVPGSHISFVQRAILPQYEDLHKQDDFIGYEEEHYNHEIDADFLSFMHASIDTAVMVDAQAASVHKQVLERAKREGKVLTLDGSNEEDEALYKDYFKQIVNESLTPHDVAENQP